MRHSIRDCVPARRCYALSCHRRSGEGVAGWEEGMTARSPWWVRPAPRARPAWRLVCFPFAGSGPAPLRPWAHELPADWDLCILHLPGREARFAEPPARRLAPLVADVAAAVATDLPSDGARVVFFGHSLGALLAFEVARALRGRAGPAQLFVSGRRSPALPSRHEPVHDLPEPQIVDALRRLGGTPPEILAHAEMMQLLLPLLRVDLALDETYACDDLTPLDCPITAFTGDDDPRVTLEEAAAWSALTRGTFRLRRFAGGHFFLLDQRAAVVAAIAAALGAP